MSITARVWRFCLDKVRALDPILLVCSTLLSVISLSVLIGGGDAFASRVVVVQLGATLVGMVAMVVLANLDYRKLAEKLSIVFFGVSVLLLVYLLIDGTGAGTNKSWLYFDFLPFGIQPTEFIKTALALTFAYHLSRVRERINKLPVLLGLSAHAGAIILLIVLTGDLGVAVVFAGFILLMLFCAGLNGWYFAALGGVALIAAPIVWSRLATYQKQRILIGFRPEMDPMGYGYQPLLSRDAIMAGGFFGQGLDGGAVFRELPASHTDFIYATVCEKLGFIGGLIVLLTLLVFIIRVIVIALRSERGLGSYLCVGLAGCLIIQIIINIGMCFGVLPVVGITLPFVSYGGSSVLGIYLMTGMVHSVHIHRNRSRSSWS